MFKLWKLAMVVVVWGALFLLPVVGVGQGVQLSGIVSDAGGEVLPFVNVYVEGTTYGTTANEAGTYSLELEQGRSYSIVFQYIGYKQRIEVVRTDGKDVVLNVMLEAQDLELAEVVVSASAEDPAYRIIREAQRMRKVYREGLRSFDCDVYVKGNQRLLDAPKKIFGVEVGDVNGGLDSTGKGIIYLAESVARLYYEQPNKYREEMISSKVSGNDNGFSFARAQGMNFNFYDNQVELFGAMVSPIADGAMQYYRYRMLGKYYDDKKRLINKIEVLPKNDMSPLFGGVVYIQEDVWNLTDIDLFVTGKAAEFAALDTLFIKQSLVPVQGFDHIWMPISQTLLFEAQMLGFHLRGSFIGVYSNYHINTDYSKRFFKNEVFKVNEEANKREAVYWDTIRPIPLTPEEILDYARKDSIMRIRNAQPYLDSVARVDNQFKLGNLFSGYTYTNIRKRNSFSINMPLAGFQYNTVQGFNAALDLTFQHAKDKEQTAYTTVRTIAQYGFADQQLMGKLSISRQFNAIQYTKLTLEGGRILQQYNDKVPINLFRNTLTSLVFEGNWMKQYERRYAEATLQHEIVNGINLYTALSYNDRLPLTNHTDFTLIDYPSRTFTPELVSTPSQAVISKTTLRFRFKQQYTTYPHRRIIQGTSYPQLYLHYTHGIYTDGSHIWFNNTTLQIKDNITLGTVGTSSYNVLAGIHHINTDSTRQYLYDLYHFNGNQAYLTYNDRYLETFQLLPYYTFSTTGKYLEAHYEHDFGSFLLRKIPLIKKLGLHNQVGAHYLTTPTDQYFEWNAGFSNIGFKLFRILRIDYHMGITNWNTIKHGATFSLKLGIGG